MKAAFVVAGIMVAALAAGSARTAGQAGDAGDALLAEVRALHADLDRAAGTSIRTQLLVARLQLQEQRITTISKEMDDLQRQTSTLTAALVGEQQTLRQVEEEFRDPSLAADRRHALEIGIDDAKRRIGDLQHQIATLTDRDSMLTGLLAAEQSRWTDFNSRLDEIEHDLSSRGK